MMDDSFDMHLNCLNWWSTDGRDMQTKTNQKQIGKQIHVSCLIVNDDHYIHSMFYIVQFVLSVYGRTIKAQAPVRGKLLSQALLHA